MYFVLFQIVFYIYGMIETNPSFTLPANVLCEEFPEAVRKIMAIGLGQNVELPKQAIYCELLNMGARNFLSGQPIEMQDIIETGNKLKQKRLFKDEHNQ